MTDSPEQERGRPRQSVGKMFFLVIIAAVLGYAVAGGFPSFWRDSAGVRHDFETMRTYARITIPDGEGVRLSPRDIALLAEAAVQEVSELMGPFGERSDIRRLNQSPKNTWIRVNPLTWKVVMEALRWNRLTEGAFDPTIGPIKRLFNFSGEVEAWPPEDELLQARKAVGADNILFSREGMALAFAVDGMLLDLGAIAKGFAADRAAEILAANGVQNALVDIGGELRVLGSRPGAPSSPWRTGIRNPRDDSVIEELAVSNAAVATSGDYENYFIHNGVRYEHIIDPRIGLPLSEAVVSVTVIHPVSCLAADALATSLTVLGLEEGGAFLRSQALGLFSNGVRVIILSIDENNRIFRNEFLVDETGEVRESTKEVL